MICEFENCGADLAFDGGGFKNKFGEVFCGECYIEHVKGTFFEIEDEEGTTMN
jgi:hypothetical protein